MAMPYSCQMRLGVIGKTPSQMSNYGMDLVKKNQKGNPFNSFSQEAVRHKHCAISELRDRISL